jgi:methylglutamate dehydrogenase subunit B
MSPLACPFCGARELAEFEFHKTVSDPEVSAFSAVYERVNRLDVSVEYWQHVHGCRAWLLVRRNPSTGEVSAISLLGGAKP